jgi:hypothetical protein
MEETLCGVVMIAGGREVARWSFSVVSPCCSRMMEEWVAERIGILLDGLWAYSGGLMTGDGVTKVRSES